MILKDQKKYNNTGMRYGAKLLKTNLRKSTQEAYPAR